MVPGPFSRSEWRVHVSQGSGAEPADARALQRSHPTSIAEIAKRAGVSKGLIYNYYRSKDALRRSGETLAPEFTRILGQFIALFAESGSDAPRMDALVLLSAVPGVAREGS